MIKTKSNIGQRFSVSNFLNHAPKRNFNKKIDETLERWVAKLPNGHLGYLIAGLNTAAYLMYVIWPKSQMYSYLNNFTVSSYNLS